MRLWVGWDLAALKAQAHRAIASMNTDASTRVRFSLGRTVATPAALDALGASGDSAHALLLRHVTCDWGAVGKEDWQANEDALANGDRLLSAYLLKDGATKVWIITEADRSSTTILIPDDY